MTFGAVIDEAGFERRFDAGDHRLVDVALALFLGGGFDVEVDQFLAIDDRHPELLGLGGIEQHAFHVLSLAQCAAGSGGEARRAATCRGGKARYAAVAAKTMTRARWRRRARGCARCKVAVGIGSDPVERGRKALVVNRVFNMRTSGGVRRLRAPLRYVGGAAEANLASGAAQCAASNRPLPGAETALILYHRYFFRGEPARER